MKRAFALRRGLLGAAATVAIILGGVSIASVNAAEEIEFPKQDWPFSGMFGTYDRASLQRGYQVYKEVCSSCHGLYQLSYRNFADLGFNPDEVKALAAEAQVTDGPNDEGQMFQRAGRPSDKVIRPFPNEQAARAANNGAYPPDLSLIVKAREGGPDYVYAVLNGYQPAPADVKMADGMNYNMAFAGHQIAMPQPLQDGQVTFGDGSPNKLPDEARNVVTFLAWAAEPEMEARKRMGVHVLMFLVVAAGLLYAAKRKIWADIH